MNKDYIKQLEDMPDLGKSYINWSEGGGGQVFRVNFDWYVLFDVPQYGGEPRLDKIYHKSELTALIDKAMSWT